MQSVILPFRTSSIRGNVGRHAWVLLTVLLAMFSGCSNSNRAAVNGKVTLDGQPIEGGTISFIPTGDTVGSPAWSKIEEGRYAILGHEGLAVGINRVEVRWSRKTGKKMPAIAPAPAGAMMEITAEAVPVRYNTQSELKRDVQQGENTLDFKLDSK